MKINVKKSEIILFIMDFLKNQNLNKTLVSLENETGIHLHQYNKEISFLRQLILDGHWTDAEEFIKPLKDIPKFEYNNCVFEIRKQKFLELVEQEPDNKSNNVEDLVDQLKDIQVLCSPNIFNQLMFCLSSPSITDHAEYKNWTPISGRLRCFDKLRGYLELIYPINKEERKIVPGIFQKLLKTLIICKFTSDGGKITTDQNLTSALSLFDEKFLKDDKIEHEFIIDNDLKGFKKIPKDDIDLLRSNNAIKAIRNEKISQSLQVNKISELEEELSAANKREEAKVNTVGVNTKNNPVTSVKIENNNQFNNLQSNLQTNYKNFSNEINSFNISQEIINIQSNNNLNTNSNVTIKNKDSRKNNILYEIKEEDKTVKSSPVKSQLKSYNKSPSPKFDEYEDEIRDVVEDNIVEISNDRLRKTIQVNQNFNFTNYSNPNSNNMSDLKNSKNEKVKMSTSNSYLKEMSVTKSKHDLSDLDKEEYYMKSCYEFYEYDICTLTERKVITDTHPIRTSCFSPQGDYFSVGTNSKSVKIFHVKPALEKFNKKNSYNFKSNIKNSKSTMSSMDDIKLVFEQKNHHMGSIYCLDWSVSGRLIASGSNDKTVKLMVIPDLEESYMLKDQEILELAISGHKGTIRSVSFEPTSDLILLSAGTVDTCIKVWDAEKGTNVTNLEGHTGDIHTVKWSNDALICGSSGLDKTIRFWDLRDYKSTTLISALKYTDINDIAIYTKNKTMASTLIAAGHSNGMITIWDYNRRNILKELFEHTDEVRSVSFSPDGKYLSSASFDSKIKLFDVENNFNLIGELEHFDRVVSVKWHPEVPMLISTSADKTARIWIPDS